MPVTTLQFTVTRSANWNVSYDAPEGTCHLNIDEGMETPSAVDYVSAMEHNTHGFWEIDAASVPEDVGEVTEIAVQFYHTGISLGGAPTCLMTLWEIGSPSVQLAQKLVNLLTAGFTAEQIVFDGLSLTRDQLLVLAVYWDMQDVGGGSGEDPPEYDGEWGGD